MARNTKDLWNRDGMFSARFRVPKRYKNLVNKTFFVESLGTDSEADALVLAAGVKSRVLANWALLAGGSAHQTATARWQGLKDVARSAGHRLMTAPEIAEAPIEEIRGRIDVLRKNPAPDLVAALLDPGPPPQDMLSQLLDLSERSPYRQRKNKKKSEGKMVLWRQTRRRAIGNFIAALAARDGGSGDKPIAKIDSEDAWELHDWWEKKVEQDNLIPGTANKDFYYIGSMISDYYRLIKNRQPPRPFAGVTMDESDTEERHRLPLPIDWIEETLIAPHPKLAELMSRNMPDGTPKTGRAAKAAEVAREAYAIAIVSVEAGCRQSEVHDTPPEHFRLNHPIPHFLIKAELAEVDGDTGKRTGGRDAKNVHSYRPVPLVGLALQLMQGFPSGFPNYRNKRGYSAYFNGVLRRLELFPEPNEEGQPYTIGGTRHSFELRMKKAGIANDDRGEMMGHSVQSVRNRELYGGEMPLDVRQKIAKLIAFGDVISSEERQQAENELRLLWERRRPA